MAEPNRRSPLHHRSEISSPGSARMVEVSFLGKLVLRGNAGRIGDAARGALGFDLPIEACTVARGDEAAALWIGPDEWWVVTETGSERKFAASLADALSGLHHQLVDNSDLYTTIELEGLRAPEMLMKLTTLDLHQKTFPPGRVAGSMFAQTQATLWHVGTPEADGPLFRLFVRWSMADYLWCLLAEAGREFGLPPQVPRAGETWRLER